MNTRNKIKLIKKITEILNNEFSVDDIELLLINIRDFARSNNFKLLLEFCDFVAHPDRKKGIIYEELDCIYSKFKYMDTQDGESLDYNYIEQKVYNLLFPVSISMMTETFLQSQFQKTSRELIQHIEVNLIKKNGATYSVKNQSAKEELKGIQKKLHIPPQIHKLTETKLLDEIGLCLSQLCDFLEIGYQATQFNALKDNVMICFLDIIRDCNIQLHDGAIAGGYLTVGTNNTIYSANPKTVNMNICFSGWIPVEKSVFVFELIQTGLLVGKHMPNFSSLIEWLNQDRTFGKLKEFSLGKQFPRPH
jgi:hypothetical protein